MMLGHSLKNVNKNEYSIKQNSFQHNIHHQH